MKTFQKLIMVSVSSLLSTFAFAQLGLGITSTTQAAVNATAASTAVTKTASMVTNSTKTTVNIAATKAIDLKSQAINRTNEVKTDLKKTSDLDAGLNGNASLQGSTNASTQNSSGSSGAQLSLNTDAGLKIRGSNAVDKVESIESTATGKVENKANAAVERGREVKATAVSETKSDLKAAKENVSPAKPVTNAKLSSSASAETKTSVTKQ